MSEAVRTWRTASYPLHLIAHNISVETTVLEFATQEEFCSELERGYFD